MHTSKPWLWEGQETYPGLYEKCIRVFAQNYYFPSTLIWKHSTSCRKHSEPIRSTGYRKTLRNPMERLYKRPLFMGGSLNTCTALFADKNTGPGGCDCSKRAVRVGAVKHTQSLRIHLMPISTLLWHTKTSGKRDPPTHPLLLASRGRSGPSYLHNCACMTLFLPGKWETYTPLWTRIWHFYQPKWLTQVVSLRNLRENGASTVKSLLTSSIAAHITPLKYYFMLIAGSKTAPWGVCLLFTGCAKKEDDSDFTSHIQCLSHAVPECDHTWI